MMYTGVLLETLPVCGVETTAVVAVLEVGLGRIWGVATWMNCCSGAAAVTQICFGLVTLSLSLLSSHLRF